MTATIRPITADATRPLRQAVLRPRQPAHELVFPGDDDAATRHLGAFLEGRLVGIASICREAMPGGGTDEVTPASGSDWRLRGMATLPDVRGSGLGGALLEACLAHVAAHGGTRLWCNARVNAAGFYRRYRFTTHGEPFELADIGPHYRMSLRIVPVPTV